LTVDVVIVKHTGYYEFETHVMCSNVVTDTVQCLDESLALCSKQKKCYHICFMLCGYQS